MPIHHAVAFTLGDFLVFIHINTSRCTWLMIMIPKSNWQLKLKYWKTGMLLQPHQLEMVVTILITLKSLTLWELILW